MSISTVLISPAVFLGCLDLTALVSSDPSISIGLRSGQGFDFAISKNGFSSITLF